MTKLNGENTSKDLYSLEHIDNDLEESKDENIKFELSHENKYRLIAEKTSDLISITTFSIKPLYTYVSPSHTKLLGYSLDELIGKNGFDFIHPDDKKNLNPILNKHILSKTKEIFTRKEQDVVERVEFRIIDKFGKWHDLESTVNIIGNELLFISKDVTDRKIMEEELRKERDLAKKYFDIAGVIFIVINNRGEITQINKKGSEILGYGPEDIVGKNWFDTFLQKDIKDQVKNVFFKLVSGEIEPVEYFENSILTKNGETKIVAWHNTILEDEYGNITGTLSSGEDITEHKKALQALRENESRFRSFFESSPDLCYMVSSKGEILNINQTALKILGINKDDVIGKSIIPTIYPNSVDRAYELVYKWKEKGKLKNEEINISTISGDRPVLLSVDDVNDENGNLLYSILMQKDISEIKKAEEDLKEADKELKELNKNLEKKVKDRTEQIQQLLTQKDEFIAQLGHDLKNPLGPLVNLLPLIEKHESDPKYHEMIQTLHRNVNYMKNLVTKTIQLAQLKSPNISINFERMNIKEEINEILKNNKLMFDENKIHIQNNVSEDISINADRLLIHEVFNNLLNNSVKYSNKDSGNIQIDAKMDRDNYIAISIKDEGIGMDEEQLGKIFHEFYKADLSRHDFDSSGLGMPIAKRIIEKHGGHIWAESEGLGKGSTFYFTLPRI